MEPKQQYLFVIREVNKERWLSRTGALDVPAKQYQLWDLRHPKPELVAYSLSEASLYEQLDRLVDLYA